MKTLTSTIVKIIANNVTIDWFKPYKTNDESEGIGTGFFIDQEGYILTCAHVVIDAIKIWITIPSIGKERINATVVGICEHSDLALLKTVDYIPKHFMKLGESDGILPGTKVTAIGYPLGQDRLKQTSGIISGRQGSNFQTDSPINPGNSGGPLVNDKFEVIGVNSSKMMYADNIGYAIPIYQFKILDPLMRQLLNKPTNQKMIFKPGLFANFNNTSQDLIDYYNGNNNCEFGYYVKKVHKKSPLRKAGIKEGDIVCAFGKEGELYEVDNYGECNVPWNSEKVHIYDVMQRYTLNDEIIIKYWRKDKSTVQFAKVQLGDMELPQIRLYYKVYDDIDYVVFGGIIVMELTGNHLQSLFNMNITRKMADHLSLYAHLKNKYEKVLIITQLFPGAHLGKIDSLNQGDIITHVNNEKVNSLSDYRDAIQKVKTVKGKKYIKYETKLNTLAVCNLETLLSEEKFLSENFKYKLDPIYFQFIKRYPELEQQIQRTQKLKIQSKPKQPMMKMDEMGESEEPSKSGPILREYSDLDDQLRVMGYQIKPNRDIEEEKEQDDDDEIESDMEGEMETDMEKEEHSRNVNSIKEMLQRPHNPFVDSVQTISSIHDDMKDTEEHKESEHHHEHTEHVKMSDFENYLSGYKSDDESNQGCPKSKIESEIPTVSNEQIPSELHQYLLKLQPAVKVRRRRRI